MEYDLVLASVSELADPNPTKKKKTAPERGTHIIQQKTVQVLEKMHLKMEMSEQSSNVW